MRKNGIEKFLIRIKTKKYRVFLAKILLLFLACLVFVFGFVKLISITSDNDMAKKETIQETIKEKKKTHKSIVVCEHLNDEKTETIEIETKDEQQQSKVEENEKIFLGEFVLTAYCSCEECCGEYAFNRPVDSHGNEIVYGSTGERLVAGVSVAVDPNVIPYGTTVIINGHEYLAQDCGGAIKGNRIDIYFENHQDALEFGVQYAKVFVR